MSNILEVMEITRFFGGLCALCEVSFAVEAGQIHGLIGPNGAGKTTLLNVLSGLTRPSSGQIRYCGSPIQALHAHKVASLGIARTFQNIRLFSGMTCLENVIAGQHLVARRRLITRLFQLPSARREESLWRERAMDTLAQVGLDHRAGVQARNLSYGERRRLEIARALASKPRLLLLDEPVAGMRRREFLEVGDLVSRLASGGMTVLLIEHNMAFVMELCTHITVLDFGRVITTGAPEEVRQHPEVIRAYLGMDNKHA